MYIPTDYPVAFVFCIVTMIFWSLWANPIKLSGQRFEIFYFNYIISAFIFVILYGLTFGMIEQAGTDTFAQNMRTAKPSKVLLTMLGGLTMNMATHLFVSAIEICGMAIAFPITVGISLIFGTTINYFIDPHGSRTLLFSGVAVAFFAVLSLAAAYHFKNIDDSAKKNDLMKQELKIEDNEVELSVAEKFTSVPLESDIENNIDQNIQQDSNQKKTESPNKSKFFRGIIVCAISGSFMALWSPPAIIALKGEGKLNSYTSLFYVVLAAMVSTFPINLLFMRYPITGQSSLDWKLYFQSPKTAHLWGVLSGFIWSIGTLFYMLSAGTLGFAVSYSLGQSSPLISCIFGIFVWKEFDNVSRKTKIFLALMFIFYIGAISLIALSN